ncbi:MAG: hypothetical protein SGJ20_00065 [Planctomycetota bacterium]|nr:hypothetical protein [Planctomycetota bacterium]
MSTGSKVDEALRNGLRTAKTKPVHYVMIGRDLNKGALHVSKKKIPMGVIAASKKSSGSSQVLRGVCYQEDDKLVFEVDAEPASSLAGVIKKLAMQNAGLTIHPVFKLIQPGQGRVVEDEEGNNAPSDSTPKDSGEGTLDKGTVSSDSGEGNLDNGNDSDTSSESSTEDLNKPKVPPRPTTQAPKSSGKFTSIQEWNTKLQQVSTANVPLKPKLAAYDKLLDQIATTVKQVNKDTALTPEQKKAELDILTAVKTKTQNDRKLARSNERVAQSNRDAQRTSRRKQLATKSNVVEKKVTELNGTLKDFKPPFDDAVITAIEQSVDVNDSSLKVVVDELKTLTGLVDQAKKGAATLAQFDQAVTATETAANEYLRKHKNPLTKEGKNRVAECQKIITRISVSKNQVTDLSTRIQGIAQVVDGLTKQGEVTPASIESLESMLKFSFLDPAIRAFCDRTILAARNALTQKAQQELSSIVNPTTGDKAQILLGNGGAKPPKSKGESDSFFINNPDGKPAFIFKSVQGEARPNLDLPEGGGTAREVLASKMNDLLKSELGLDLGVLPTVPMQLEDDAFKNGTKSHATKRTGALQQAVTLTPGQPSSAKQLFDITDKAELTKRLNAIPKDDVDKIALLDFITLNADRHAENLMVSGTSDNPTLVPIDAGQMLPTKAFYNESCTAMGSLIKCDINNPSIAVSGQALIPQLPQAQQKFSDKILQQISAMDPDKIVAGMKAGYQDMVEDAPDLNNTLDDDTLDLTRRSIKFLKKAAPQLTISEISTLYAEGFLDIMNAKNEQELDAAIQQAVDDMLTLRQELAKLGEKSAENAVKRQLGVDSRYPIKLQARILKNKPDKDTFQKQHFVELQADLQDIATFIGDSKEKVTNELTRAYDEETYKTLRTWAEYKRFGGDPKLKFLLAGDPATYLLEASGNSIASKSRFTFKEAGELIKLGGYPALQANLTPVDFAKVKGKSVSDQTTALFRALQKQGK